MGKDFATIKPAQSRTGKPLRIAAHFLDLGLGNVRRRANRLFLSQDALKQLNALLLDAAEKGNHAEAARLIKAGADAESANQNGWTPLHLAAGNGHLQA